MKTNAVELSEDSIDLSDLIVLSADVESSIGTPDLGIRMSIESVTLGMPVQLEIAERADGRLALGGIPPTHYVATSFSSVFHQLQLTLTPITEGTTNHDQ